MMSFIQSLSSRHLAPKPLAYACTMLLMVQSALTASAAFAEEHASHTDPNAPILALNRLTSLQGTDANALVFNAPHVEEFFTQTGTRVLFVAAPELPILDLHLTFDAGSARDIEIAANVSGLASLTAQLLDEGTPTQSAADIAKTFETLGAQYNATAYRDMFTLDLRTLADARYHEPAVQQLLNLLKNADFPEDSIARIKQNADIGQQQQQESPAAVANIRFWRELYGQHPYAEPSTGTQPTIAHITRTQLQAFKQQFLVAKNLNLAMTGQLTLAQAKQLAERITQSLPLGQHAKALPAAPVLTQARRVNVNYPSTQTHVLMGQTGITRAEPDLPALTVGNDILGGGDFNAQLMQELRLKRGLTYGVYSNFTAMRSAGPFVISYSTRNSETQNSIAVTNQTLQQFMTSPLDTRRVDEAKAGILNSYPASLASNQSINGYLGMMGFYGLSAQYLNEYPQQVARVSANDIQQAFKRHVDPNRLLTVVVGPTTDTASTQATAQAQEPVKP